MKRDEMAGIAVPVLAKQIARNAIKEHLRRQGVKLSYVSAREIVAQAKAGVREHPEIIREARARAVTLGYVADLGSTHSHSKGTAEPQSLTEIRLWSRSHACVRAA